MLYLSPNELLSVLRFRCIDKKLRERKSISLEVASGEVRLSALVLFLAFHMNMSENVAVTKMEAHYLRPSSRSGCD